MGATTYLGVLDTYKCLRHTTLVGDAKGQGWDLAVDVFAHNVINAASENVHKLWIEHAALVGADHV